MVTNTIVKCIELVSSLLCNLRGGFHLLKGSIAKSQELFSTSTLYCSHRCSAWCAAAANGSHTVEVQNLVQNQSLGAQQNANKG